jgi:hypothetical protein
VNSTFSQRLALRAVWLVCGCSLACDRQPELREMAPAASASAVAHAPQASPAPKASAQPANPWQGRWQGACNLEKTDLKLPGNQGVQIAWIKDTGKQRSGAGTLSCDVSATGVASCVWTQPTPEAASGSALPELVGIGTWEDPTRVSAELRTRSPAPPATAAGAQPGERLTHFTGTLQAERSDPGTLTGTLRLASGDGKTLRSASFVLKHAPPGTPP